MFEMSIKFGKSSAQTLGRIVGAIPHARGVGRFRQDPVRIVLQVLKLGTGSQEYLFGIGHEPIEAASHSLKAVNGRLERILCVHGPSGGDRYSPLATEKSDYALGPSATDDVTGATALDERSSVAVKTLSRSKIMMN